MEINSDIKAIELFASRCEEMMNSRYILADKKIAGILKCMVSAKILIDIAEQCLSGFDYEMEFMMARTPLDGGSRCYLQIPADRRKRIAFVLCLLGELDGGTRNLHTFLDNYFYADGSVYESYLMFCRELIMPFCKSVVAMAANPYEDTEAVQHAEHFFEMDYVELNTRTAEEMVLTIQQVAHMVSEHTGYTPAEKGEMLSITGGLANAIVAKDAKLIKLLWIGFKNTFKNWSGAEKTVAELERKLNAYHII